MRDGLHRLRTRNLELQTQQTNTERRLNEVLEAEEKNKLEAEKAKSDRESMERRLEDVRGRREEVERSLKRANDRVKKRTNEEREAKEELSKLEKKVEKYLKKEDGEYSIKLENIQEIELLREELKIARENNEEGLERNNELKAENEKLDKKRLNSEKTVGELRERLIDEKNQVALNKGKAVEFVRRMDRADAEVRNLNAYIKSRAAVEEAKDENIRQLRSEVDRLKRCADREEEIMKSKKPQ